MLERNWEMPDIIKDRRVLLDRINDRSSLDNPEVFRRVLEIMNEIRSKGDEALKILTEKFDGVLLDEFIVSKAEIKRAYEEIDEEILGIIREAAMNIREFHEKQMPESWIWNKAEGIRLGQKTTPMETVGCYVPGGTAPLVSTVLMNVIPAKAAGVKKVVLCTPPAKDGTIDAPRLVAAAEAGADIIIKAGGAQAIFSMAFGTKTVPKVDKITGPGNIYVANAKKLAYGYCGIDMIAGPSEILIIADSKADPRFIAADMLGQAEHDTIAASILITCDESLAMDVNNEIFRQLSDLPRKETAGESIRRFGSIYLAKDKNDAIETANSIAPEHLELLVENPCEYEPEITNAGAIFMGCYSPEPLGDYWAGPNHTLPTGGTARFYSPLGVYDFMKRTSIIEYSEERLRDAAQNISGFARAEGLEAHARAIEIRFRGDSNE
jgi:histidinol dehydrogenase